MTSVIGLAAVLKNLEAVHSRAEVEAGKAVRTTAQMIRSEAIRSIKSHQSSGNAYKRGNVTHTASTTGNPPNQDRGHLARNIRVELHDDLTATVGSYAAALTACFPRRTGCAGGCRLQKTGAPAWPRSVRPGP